MKKIVLTYNLPLDRFTRFLKDIEVVYPLKPLAKFSREELEKIIIDADVLITIADYPCDQKLIDLAPNLKIIGNLGSGFDNVDVNYASKKGIYVLNTPTSVVQPTAEMTIALILSICRSTARYDRDLRESGICEKTLLFERDMMINGKTLGIIGFGRIGKAVAKKAAGLGMNIIYYDLYKADKNTETALNASFLPLEDVIKTADVLTLHMPYSQEYHHFMNEDKIRMMKPTGYLINASRGPVVDEKALIIALKKGTIRGAALDVHEFEPNISKEIRDLSNILITPHCCTNIADIRLDMLMELLEGINSARNGITPSNVVNLIELKNIQTFCKAQL